MSLVSGSIRIVILAIVLIPRLYRTLLWRTLNGLNVPLSITAPTGAALAVLIFWAPLALLLPAAAPLAAHVVAWMTIAIVALLSAVRWLLVEVAAGRI